MNELEQEFTNALAEERQPNCIDCKKPLEVIQDFGDTVAWIWDETQKKYIKRQGLGEAEKPECAHCGSRDWNLVDANEATQKLGLEY